MSHTDRLCRQFLFTYCKLPISGRGLGLGDVTHFRNFATLSIFRKRLKLRFSNSVHRYIERGQLLLTDHKLAPKLAWHGSHDPISKLWDPFNISGTDEDTLLEFSI